MTPTESDAVEPLVLVVDDDPGVRTLVVIALTKGGYRCVAAANVDEALELLAERGDEIELVLSDVMMPGKSGFDLTERVRELDEELPVVLMTGYADLENARKALKLGADDFILKPLEIKELRRSLARIMERRKLRRENRAFRKELEERYFDLLRLENQKAHLTSLVLDDLAPQIQGLGFAGERLEKLLEPIGGEPLALAQKAANLVTEVELMLRTFATIRSLDPSTRTANQGASSSTHVEVRRITDEAVRDILPAYRTKNVSLTHEPPAGAGDLVVKTDGWLLRREVNALLEVGLRRSEGGQAVSLTLKSEKTDGITRVLISVADQGPRIPETLCARILAGASPEEVRAAGFPVDGALALRFVSLAAKSRNGQFEVGDGTPEGGARYTISFASATE